LIIREHASQNLSLRLQLLDPLALKSLLSYKPRVARNKADGSEQDKNLKTKELQKERPVFYGILMQ
jgi:hypothetical protein